MKGGIPLGFCSFAYQKLSSHIRHLEAYLTSRRWVELESRDFA